MQDLKPLFKAGQDIDVWVKFIDVKEYKLGLQLFPPIESSTSSGDHIQKFQSKFVSS